MERSVTLERAAPESQRPGLLPEKTAGMLQCAPQLLLFPALVLVQLGASALGGIGFVLGNPTPLMVGGSVAWLVWFTGLFIISLQTGDERLRRAARWLRPIAIYIFALLALVTLAEASLFVTGFRVTGSSQLFTALQHTFAYNDATALTHQATDNLLQGKNPYAEGNIVTAIQQFHGSSDRTTPRREGELETAFPYPSTAQLEAVWRKATAEPAQVPPEIETRMNYPAGAFVLPAPFIRLGVGDIRLVYIFYIIAGLATTLWICPKRVRWLLAGAIAMSLAFWNSIASGETGSLAFPFMLIGWVMARKHPWPSAVLFGLAISAKQTAWFLAPFYIILLLRTFGIKKTLLLTCMVAAVFFGINLPFIIRDPGLWINSMGAPMSADFFPLGAGIVTLVTSGLVTIRSPLIFTIAEGAVLAGGAVWYFFNCRRYPHTGPVLAFFPLFFAWRSLWPYFFYIDLIVIAAVVIDYGAGPGHEKVIATRPAVKSGAIADSRATGPDLVRGKRGRA